MVELLQMGVHGICSNDPRLFAEAERIVAGDAPAESPQEDEAKKAEKQTVKAEKQEAKAQKKASKKAAKAEG